MKLKSGLPFSLLRFGLPFNYPKLSSSTSCDVVILGGGISGALCAHALCEAGIDCIVVDRRTIGLGSTAASTSLLQYEIDVSLNDLSTLRGKENAARTYLLCSDTLMTLETLCQRIGFTGFKRTNSLYYGYNKKDEQRLKEEYRTRKSIGLDVQYLDREDLRERYEISAFGAIESSNAAHADAYALTHAILQHCLKKGVRVFDRTNITKVTSAKGKLRATSEDGFTIQARHIIYATGYEAVEVLKKKVVSLRSTYVTISESMNDCSSLPFHSTLVWNTADPYLYMRCTDDGRIIVGGRDDKYHNPTRRDAAIDRKAKLLTRDFEKLFPDIPFIPEFSWAGTFGTTKDGLPFIGKQTPSQNKYFALGFGGNGIVFSMIAAQLIRDAILGKKNPDSKLFSFDRA
ncbi:MAG TPA: FAD-dependent oxidoreductase [Chryseosolibacter sp.]